MADPRKLRQALANLVSNAVKFSPHGGEVLVEVSREPGKLRYTIYDQGPGIRERASRTGSSSRSTTRARAGPTRRARRARGSGLPVARRIAEAHGGRVWVESPPRTQPALARAPLHRLASSCSRSRCAPADQPAGRQGLAPAASLGLIRGAPGRYTARSSTMRVLVAMSGGVDSSTAAALLAAERATR